MLTIFFAIVACVCAAGWVSRYISTMAMIYYMQKNGYRIPNEEELKNCTTFVVKHLVNDLFK